VAAQNALSDGRWRRLDHDSGGFLLRGEPDGNFVAVDAKTGDVLWKFQTGFGSDAPATVYEVDGEQYIAITTGGNSIQGSAYGDAV